MYRYRQGNGLSRVLQVGTGTLSELPTLLVGFLGGGDALDDLARPAGGRLPNWSLRKRTWQVILSQRHHAICRYPSPDCFGHKRYERDLLLASWRMHGRTVKL